MKRIVFILLACLQLGTLEAQNGNHFPKQDYDYFLDFFATRDRNTHQKALIYINDNWSEDFEALAIESLVFFKKPFCLQQASEYLAKKDGQKLHLRFQPMVRVSLEQRCYV